MCIIHVCVLYMYMYMHMYYIYTYIINQSNHQSIKYRYNQNRETSFYHVNQSWEQGILVFTFRTFPELECSPLSIISVISYLDYFTGLVTGLLVSLHYHL